MASDILLNDGDNKDWVTVEGAVLLHRGSDLMVDSPARRKSNSGHRRTLVHDYEDGLTINFNGDYPGGVTLHDLRKLSLRPVGVLGKFRLPKSGQPGDVIMVHYRAKVFMPTMIISEVDMIESTTAGEQLVPDSPELATIPYVASSAGEIDPHLEVGVSPVADGSHTLWVCIGTNDYDQAMWSQVPLGDPIVGE